MPEVEVNLNQVLQVLDQLNPAELAEVERRLAARKQNPAPLTDAAADLFELPFAGYLALSDEARLAIARRAYQTLGSWIDEELAKRKAAWMLVCGGKIIEFSPTLHDYPTRKHLMELGQQRGLVPFVFIRTPLIEESGWSALSDNDFYPTGSLIVAAPGASEEQLQAAGVELTADFDSGSPSIFVNYERMLAFQVIASQPIDQAHYRVHLGQAYYAHILPLLIGVREGEGTITVRELPAHFVRNWRRGPLCLINPKREALAGRNLLLEFPLRVELNGATKTTKVASA